MASKDNYEKDNDVADLQKAIRSIGDAIDGTPKQGSSNRAIFLNNLAAALGCLYARDGETIVIDEAISVSQEAVELIPADHRSKGLFLTTLGARLEDGYKKTKQVPDFESANSCYQIALNHKYSPTVPRMTSGLALIALCAKNSDWSQAYEAAKVSVGLLNLLAPRDLDNSDKQYMLSLFFGLACDGTAAALNAGKSPIEALDLLERGRGIIAASLEEMHTDVLELKENHPELAEKFSNLRDEFTRISQRDHLLTDESAIVTIFQEESDRLRETNIALDNFIQEIRDIPEFKDFLRLPGAEELQSAAIHCPIVVLNVSQYRCDAFLISQSELRVLTLPQLKLEDIKSKAQYDGLGSLPVLEWLWDVVASPVLEALGLTQLPQGDDWPRICSSVKTIVHGRCRPAPVLDLQSGNYALLVGMEKTPNLSDLPFATEEIDSIRSIVKSMGLEPVQSARSKQDVLSSLQNCVFFHFAGHSYSHPTDPSQSFMYLQDWQNDRLTVKNLLDLNIRKHPPFLAYLSACRTGPIKREDFRDESIHLINAFQLAGFRHVIGTLWSVNDKYCSEVSRIVYQGFKNELLSETNVSMKLHLATRVLRDRWVDSMRKTNSPSRAERKDADISSQQKENIESTDVAREYLVEQRLRDIDLVDEEESDPLDWVQYVHFGL